MALINSHWEVSLELIAAGVCATQRVPVTTEILQSVSSAMPKGGASSPTNLAIDASGIGPGFLTALAVDPAAPTPGTYVVKLEIDGTTTLVDYPITYGLPADNWVVGRPFSPSAPSVQHVLDSLYFEDGFKVWAHRDHPTTGGGTMIATYQTMDWV